jgi:hypothetical protein
MQGGSSGCLSCSAAPTPPPSPPSAATIGSSASGGDTPRSGKKGVQLWVFALVAGVLLLLIILLASLIIMQRRKKKRGKKKSEAASSKVRSPACMHLAGVDAEQSLTRCGRGFFGGCRGTLTLFRGGPMVTVGATILTPLPEKPRRPPHEWLRRQSHLHSQILHAHTHHELCLVHPLCNCTDAPKHQGSMSA